MQYIRSIDGLRAIAVLAVVFHHSEIPYFKGGFLGVDVFFVISGFLIGRIITSELDQGTFSVGTFLLKRARRLLPSLLLLLLAVELLSYLLLLPHECLTISRSVPFVLSFTSNYYFASNLNYWDGAANENFTIHTWSLGVEEQFYIVFPVLMLSMYAVCKKAKGSVVALLLVASMGLAEVASKTNASILAFYSLPTRFWELATGVLLAFSYKRSSCDRGGLLASGAGLLLVGLPFLLLGRDMNPPGMLTCIPVIGTALVIRFSEYGNPCNSVLKSGPLVALGVLSYGVYLWHQPIAAMLRALNNGHLEWWHQCLVLPLSVGLAILSHYFVEKPLRYRRNPDESGQSTTRFGVGVLASAAIALGISYSCSVTNGWPGRYRPADRPLASLDIRSVAKEGWGLFRSLEHQPFAENGKKNVLVIGDSYAKDILNMLALNGLLETRNGSTFHISNRCGALFTDREYRQFIAKEDCTFCSNQPGYEDSQLRRLLARADTVVLASKWLDWQVPFIPDTVRHIQALSSAHIIVVGRKSFGEINIRRLLELEPAERCKMSAIMNHDLRETRFVNDALRAELQGVEVCFFDIQAEIENTSRGGIAVFTPAGDLYSYDGGHLTPEGARCLGENFVRELVRTDSSVTP